MGIVICSKQKIMYLFMKLKYEIALFLFLRNYCTKELKKYKIVIKLINSVKGQNVKQKNKRERERVVKPRKFEAIPLWDLSWDDRVVSNFVSIKVLGHYQNLFHKAKAYFPLWFEANQMSQKVDYEDINKTMKSS